jgi:hypothetical protein
VRQLSGDFHHEKTRAKVCAIAVSISVCTATAFADTDTCAASLQRCRCRRYWSRRRSVPKTLRTVPSPSKPSGPRRSKFLAASRLLGQTLPNLQISPASGAGNQPVISIRGIGVNTVSSAKYQSGGTDSFTPMQRLWAFNESARWSAFSWRTALDSALAQEASVYAGASTGFKEAAFNGGSSARTRPKPVSNSGRSDPRRCWLMRPT